MKISTDVILILRKIAECVSREITTQEKLDFLAASNDFKEFIVWVTGSVIDGEFFK